MLRHIFTSIFAVIAMSAASAGPAQSQAYSPEKMSIFFPKATKSPVRFLNCQDMTCGFQSETPLVAVFFVADDAAQNIRMFSVTFHASKSQIASELMRDSLRFAQFPEANDIDTISLMKSATPSGQDVEIQEGLGAKLVNLIDINENVFSFRFYRMKN